MDREIGRGGMSIVYLALDLPRNRFVALKVFRPDIAAVLGPDRFLDEIQVAAGLAHPHILPLFDSDVADGLLFYTMPYVEGESLRQRLTRERRLPVAEAVSIACDVAEALSYAHAKNIVHRDIKPENILLEAGHPVISDFGIARAIREADVSRKTGTGLVIGTVGYMSPEQATGQKEIDGRSDIYSLGCVLYEMLVGRTPSDKRTSLISERHDVPIEVQLAIETALAEQPGERYATAAEFATALRLPQTVSSASRQQRIRRRWRAAAIVAAVVLGTAGAVVLPRLRASPLDASLYVVVPFTHREGAAPKLITGDRCESLLVEAFGRWEDVRLVDDLRVHDLHARTGADAGTLDQPSAIIPCDFPRTPPISTCDFVSLRIRCCLGMSDRRMIAEPCWGHGSSPRGRRTQTGKSLWANGIWRGLSAGSGRRSTSIQTMRTHTSGWPRRSSGVAVPSRRGGHLR